MPTNPYTLFIKLCVQIFFVLQSIALIIPSCLYRLASKIFKTKNIHINPFTQTHQDVFKTNNEIMKVEGFDIRQFECKTEDDAYVTFWRIVRSQTNQKDKHKTSHHLKPVLIQHGLLDCAMSWFLHTNPQLTIQNSQQALPYLLAKQGYDVWVGNNRGTKYSNKNSQKAEYWQYSLDHLIHYDFPSMINYILSSTGHKKLVYIGHSQGTTQFLSAIDVHPEIGQKIQTFVGFGPVISLKNLQNHFLIKVMDRLRICQVLKFVGFKSMLIIPNWMSKLIGVMIYNSWFYFKGFMMVVTGLCGTNKIKHRINFDRFGVIISHEPGGSSINNALHWIQIYRRGYLHKYDHGKIRNIQLYGCAEPPQYTYNKLVEQQFDLHLFRGTSDRIITDKDFDFLTSKLNPSKYTIHCLQDYAHLDYIWCQDASSQIYQPMIKILNKKLQEI